jgi:hypothetical protein
MATLFNTKIKDTYQSLLKLEDNTILTTTVKNVTDGLGNASPLYMSTTQVRIGSTSGSAMYWDNVNNRLGVGTNAPSGKVHFITDDCTTPTSFSNQTSILAGTLTQALLAGYSSTNGAFLNALSPGVAWYKINYGALQHIFSNAGVVSAVIDTNTTFGNGTTSLSARVGIKGSGTTSSSTALLVQNSLGTAALSVNDAGNVLIGTTTDAGYKLDVNGTARVTGAIKGGEGSSFNDIYFYGGGDRKIKPGANQLDITDSAGTSGFQVGGSGGPKASLGFDTFSFVRDLGNFTHSRGATQILTLNLGGQYVNHLTPFADIVAQGYASSAPSGNNTTLRLYTTNTTSGTYGNIIIGHNGTVSTGNVGIGTSSPTTPLTIAKSGSNNYFNFEPSATGTPPYLQALYQGNVDARLYFGSSLQIRSGTSTPYGIDCGGITSSGNIFVGGGKLEIASSTDNVLQFTDLGAINIGVIGTADATSYIQVRTGNATNMSNGTLSTAFFNSGNVGIGTTTDAGYKLDVNGTARVNGVLTVGNSTITGNFGAMTLSNNGVAGVALSFTNSSFGSNNPCILGTQGLSAHSSSQLEIKSTTKGFLPPRMTSTQRDAIATPATGLQVFDTTQNAICEYTGTAWRTVSGGKQVINATTGATTLDLSLGNVADVTLTLSTVLTLSNPTVGTYVIKLIQDAIGGKTVSWPFNVLWSGSTPPTLTATANRTDVITLLYDGVNFYGTYALNF